MSLSYFHAEPLSIFIDQARSNIGDMNMIHRKRKNTSVPDYDYSPADPFGSYTGRSKENEKPVQDADDL